MSRGWRPRAMALCCFVSTFPVLAAQSPPTLLEAELFTLPPKTPNGGIVALQVGVSVDGKVDDVVVVDPSAPFTQLLVASVRRWRFRPATDEDQPIPAAVLVLGVFRPPTLQPREDESRTRLRKAPEVNKLPVPARIVNPAYPPRALGSGMSILELQLTHEASEPRVRVVGSSPAFESESKKAAAQFTFETASVERAANVYVVFGYPTPWLTEKNPN